MDYDINKWNELIEELEEALRLTKLNEEFSSNYLYVLVAIGVPANVLTVLAMLTFKPSPATFLVAVLATCDGCALIFKLFFQKIFEYIQNSALCKTEFIPVFFTVMANWTLVLICLERFVLVCFPSKRLYLLTKKTSYIAVALLGIIFFVTLSTLFSLMREHLAEYICYTHKRYLWFWIHIYLKIIANSIAFYIPFLFIFIFTAGIIIKLKLSSREKRRDLQNNISQNTGSIASANINDRQQNTGSIASANINERQQNTGSIASANINGRQIAEAEKLERVITVMMTLTALYFLVFSLPSCIFYTLPAPTYDENNILSFERYKLFENIQYLLLDSTHVINFFLYVLTGKRFRSQLKKVLICKPLRKYIEKKKNVQELTDIQSTSNTQMTHDEM